MQLYSKHYDASVTFVEAISSTFSYISSSCYGYQTDHPLLVNLSNVLVVIQVTVTKADFGDGSTAT